jgi:DNA-binding transcriptional ArsR family regulator
VDVRSHVEVWGPYGPELVVLDDGRVTVGRDPSNDVALAWDATVSSMHAVLERYPAGWAIRDVGSSNGTFLNGERLLAEHRLRDRDEIRVGATRLVFRTRAASDLTETTRADGPPVLTPREKDVLVALCRPILGSSDAFSHPASVRQLAERLVVSEAAVKFHLANLYAKFGLEEAGDSRRVRLANEAIRRRAVTLADLREPA